MRDSLDPLPSGRLEEAWCSVIEMRLREEVERSELGQRLRIEGLPRTLIERVAKVLFDDPLFDADVCFVDKHVGLEPWRVGVHKVVERRNDQEGVVIALLPPDVRLAAGDSLDVSTFRAVATDALALTVEEALFDSISPEIRPLVQRVLSDVETRPRPPTKSARLTYLATVAAQRSQSPQVVGGALFALGLVPDFALFDDPSQVSFRIGQENLKLAVEPLRDGSRTLLERIMRLPLSDNAFRQRLLALIATVGSERVEDWGCLIATDPIWRDLSLELWPFDMVSAPGNVIVGLEMLKLPTRDDGVLVYDPREKLRVSWRTTPQAKDVPGLAYFRVEAVRSDGVIAWESPLIKVTGSVRRSKELKNLDLDPNVYFMRVVGLTDTGDPFENQPPRDPDDVDGKRTNESDDFIITDISDMEEDLVPVTTTAVGSYAEAELLARWAAVTSKKDPAALPTPDRMWLVPIDASVDICTVAIRFESQRQFTVRLSQRLRQLEEEILRHPDLNGAREIVLSRQPTWSPSNIRSVPEDFEKARRRIFDAILATNITDGSALTSLADLCGLADVIEDYAAKYIAWLATGDPEAVGLDTLRVVVPNGGTFALVAPTHPLRMLWLLQQQAVGRAWTFSAVGRPSVPGDIVGIWRRVLSPSGLPSLVVLSGNDYFVDAGPLPGGWGAYISPRQRDSRASMATLRRRIGATAYSHDADTAVRAIADRLQAFVQQHAYITTLVLNVINPGDGALIVSALEDIETRLGRSSTLRYEVRLFAEGYELSAVGRDFQELMDPERQLSEAAARLAGPGLSFLFPKLTWSRKPLTSFMANPQDYSAHVTLILDHFSAKLSVAAAGSDDRSSFVYGLVQESPQRFVGRGSAFRWVRRPAPTACPDLPGADGRSVLLAAIVRGMAQSQASVLTATNKSEYVAVSELDLDRAAQSLLYSAHSVSTWVLTLDANLGLDYFDARGRLDRPGYLLDFTPEFLPEAGRQLLLTTRADEELARLVAPLLDQVQLDPEGPGARLILESLRALSGRLALRLASSPSQRQGALGMALAKLFLESFGLLEDAVVIPLDAHPELARRSASSDPQELRSDLLVVSADPYSSHLSFLVVEAKCLSGGGLGAELRGRIDAQTTSSVAGLRDAFELAELDGRIDRQVQSWKLTTVLNFYLGRAVRYRLVDPEVAQVLRRFFLRLDEGYSVSFKRIGLVFRYESPVSQCDRADLDLPIWIVGRDIINDILAEGLASFTTTSPAGEEQEGSSEAQLAPVPVPSRPMTTHPTWTEVRSDFGGSRSIVSTTGSRATEASRYGSQNHMDGGGDDSGGSPRPGSTGPSPGTPPIGTSTAPEPDPAKPELGRWVELDESLLSQEPDTPSTGPHVDVMLGDSDVTPQYGVLGTVAAEPSKRIGLDLNGCNTISVFGVQGSGKSYTLGSILEMAVKPISAVNLLPGPLGAVVFHYHQTQDYPPEFVSMVEPNEDSNDIAALHSLGAEPTAIEDLVVLTTADMVNSRQLEFPGINVKPIRFGSAELTVADWRFLMAATGNDSLYLKVVNRVMQDARNDLTVDAIRDGLASATLSDPQRALAMTRLDLASRFIDDSSSLRSLLRPGRIIIVDLRDEFIEREEALGLFITMLNVFSGAGAGTGDSRFNKMIVFDEAHKYMGGSLMKQVVEVIREMRHKGVSVVIASQDPVNVPQDVVELSSVVVLHRFNSPSWLKHIQRSLAALGDLTPAMLASLRTGEAFAWANRSSNPVFTRHATKIRMRPRVTRHGGSTRKVIN